MLNTYEQKSRTKLVTTIVAVLVIAGIVLVADHLKAQKNVASSTTNQASTTTSTSTTTPTTTTPTTDSSSSTSTNTSDYKDGTYTASGSYYVPHGQETIKVTLTLANGIITDSSLQNSEGDRDSAQYQEEFTADYKSYVIGKKISSLQLGVIAGASDTTQAFDDALNQIASEAKA